MTKETEKTYDDYFNEFFDEKNELKEEENVSTEQDEDVSTEDEQVLEDESGSSDEETTSEDTSDDGVDTSTNSEGDEYDSLLDSIEDDGLKEKVQHLIQSDKSQKGRVSALTKKLNKLEEHYNNAIAAPEAPANRQPPEREAPASTAEQESGRKKKDEELSPEMAALKEKYPAVYSALESMAESKFESERKELQRTLDERVRPVEDSYKEEANRREAQRLEKMANELFDTDNTGIDIREVIGSKDFASWLKGQPPRVRSFYKNASTADEAMLVLNKFENDYQYMQKVNQELEKYDKPQKNEKPDSKKGDEIKAKRDAAKSKSVSPKSKSTPTTAVDTSDYDSIFERMWGEDGIYRTKRANG